MALTYAACPQEEVERLRFQMIALRLNLSEDDEVCSEGVNFFLFCHDAETLSCNSIAPLTLSLTLSLSLSHAHTLSPSIPPPLFLANRR